MKKCIYQFGDGKAEGSAHMRDLLGGKGANLAEMSSLRLPVPPGFTITTEVCSYFTGNDNTYPDGLESELASALENVERALGRTFGSPEKLRAFYETRRTNEGWQALMAPYRPLVEGCEDTLYKVMQP